MNALATSLVILIAFIFEGIAAPVRGFYLVPALAMLAVFFSLPIVVRALNAVIAGCVGFLVLSLWGGGVLTFTLPYGMVLSLILYGIAKK